VTPAFGRRAFLGGLGLGSLALASLLDERVARPAPRARRVIYLFMAGGPSQLDLFDPKPELREREGQPLPPSLAQGERFAFIRGTPRLLGSPFSFQRHGEGGAWFSSLLPETARLADELAFVRSVYTTQLNHAPAQVFMSTGHQSLGRPSVGAWLSYGLGAINRDLPTFVVMMSGESNPDGGAACWGSGFLPTEHQGIELRGRGDPVLFLSDPPGVSRAARADSLRTIASLNARHLARSGHRDIAERTAAYELAFRMQAAVPELVDVAAEPPEVHALYGTTPGRPSFANNCLLARRLVERGCRFVELFHRGWDTHGVNRSDDLVHRLPALCRQTDRATAALLIDLRRRGLLEDTLVVWGGEFGRTPMVEARDGSRFLGRDHHRHAFTMWLAGAGVRPGLVLGETDDLGYRIVSEPVGIHDLHATLLHLLGLDHTRLVYRYQGRNFRLTDVEGKAVQRLLA
jgi:Protein of unknown function (DUF1501)